MTSFPNLFPRLLVDIIPRRYRVEYISGLSKECAEEYQGYVTMFEAEPFSEETMAKGEKVKELPNSNQ